jgi:pentatricopeptide repeat protein
MHPSYPSICTTLLRHLQSAPSHPKEHLTFNILPSPQSQVASIIDHRLDRISRRTMKLYTLVALVSVCAKVSLGFSFSASGRAKCSAPVSVSVSSSVSSSIPVPQPWGISTDGHSCRSNRRLYSTASGEVEIELEEDEYDFESTRSFAEYQDDLQHLARTTSKDPTAAAKATKLFDHMFEAYIMTEDAALWPNTTIYNLMLEVHAYSRDPDGATEADRILQRMEDPETASVARPNLETYAKVMEAWAKRRQPAQVEQVLERMQTNSQSSDDDLQVDTVIYNRMIRAFGMAGDADRAASILDKMLESVDEDEASILKPDYKTFVYTARAFATPKYKDTGVEKIKSLMEKMTTGEEDWEPRTEMYNALLRALSYRKGGAREGEQVLYEMIEKSSQGQEEMRPNAESFYNVIQAYRRVSDSGVGVKVEKLMELQEALRGGAEDGDALKPEARTYNAAMAAMSRARDPKKAVRSKQLMDRMKEQYKSGDDSFAPTLFSYQSLLNSCAFTTGEPEDKLAAFQIAVDALKELRESDYLEPDSSAYGLFLRACANLMPPSRKRDAVIENVFLKCCKDGFLSQNVLEEFENGASEELQLKVIGGFLEDGVQPPEEWSRNVVD